jgi:aspartate racemase
MHAPLIGILGGMGPFSTGMFLDLIAATCVRRYCARHDIDFPRLLICSQPAPFYPDRAPDHEALAAATLDGLRLLDQAGADFIAMACNTVHAYHGQLAAQLRAPLLNIVDESLARLGTNGRRVALIASRATAESGIYQAGIQATGREYVDLGMQATVDRLLLASHDDAKHPECETLWQELLASARTSGADHTLVACFDLSTSIRRHGLSSQVVDTAHCLADATVARWQQLLPR